MGELQQHKELGKPKPQTCHRESSPWEMFHVVNAMVSGLEWGAGVTNERQLRGWRKVSLFPGRCTLQCPEEKMAKLASLVQNMNHNPGKMLDHAAASPALS